AEDRRLEEMAVLESGAGRPMATANELALPSADLDVRLDFVDRGVVDERPDVGRGLQPIAQAHAARAGFEALEWRFENRALDYHSTARGAAPAGRAERRPHDPVRGPVQVRHS